MAKPCNLPTFCFWDFSTKTLLEGGPASKETAFFHMFMPILRFIARKAGSLNSGKVTRDLKQLRQTHKVFMAGNNQNSDNFTVMLGGCCVQKCLPMFVQYLSDSCNFKLHVESLCKKGLRLYASCKTFAISRWSFSAAMNRGVAPSFVRPWSLLAPDSTRNRTTSRCP